MKVRSAFLTLSAALAFSSCGTFQATTVNNQDFKDGRWVKGATPKQTEASKEREETTKWVKPPKLKPLNPNGE